MNYLGHLYLSGTDPDVLFGNFIADAVKGRDLSAWPERVALGIRLHRAIDSFTDQHPSLRAGRARVRAHAGLYAGVVMDLFYDHLLASTWTRWHAEPLTRFVAAAHATLDQRRDDMPRETAALYHVMRDRDWLVGYASVDGLCRALDGLSRRALRGHAMAGAERVLTAHLPSYLDEFERFLPEVRAHIDARHGPG